MKKIVIICMLVVIGSIGISSVKMYAKESTVYYYKTKNILGEDLILVSTENSKDKAYEEYQNELEQRKVDLNDGRDYSYSNTDTGIFVELDGDGIVTCYDSNEKIDCSDEIIQNELKREEEQQKNSEFKEFTDIYAKLDLSNNNMICYKGNDKVSCEGDEFEFNYAEDNLIYLGDTASKVNLE